MLNKNNLAVELKLYAEDRRFEQIQMGIKQIEKKCETAEMEKLILSNSVRYDLVVNFEHNLRKDIRKVEQLIEKWKRQLNDNKLTPPATEENKVKQTRWGECEENSEESDQTH
uniref:Uncharacterized protein n=1 Tax=Globodera pallida TaxID=36090 RepID=A0A183CEK8_GLOPA